MQVLTLDAHGRCDERHRTSNAVFSRRFPERAVHGGANPLLVSSKAGDPFHIPNFHRAHGAVLGDRAQVSSTAGRPFYFASVLHTKDAALQCIAPAALNPRLSP